MVEREVEKKREEEKREEVGMRKRNSMREVEGEDLVHHSNPIKDHRALASCLSLFSCLLV